MLKVLCLCNISVSRPMFVWLSNNFSGLLSDLWSNAVELRNRKFDIRKDASSCISGGDEKGSGRGTMKKSLRDGL